MFLPLKYHLAKEISEAAQVSVEDAENSIELPKGGFGDVASSICFSLARVKKKAPAQLAMDIAGKIRLPHWFEHVKAEGGYLNFILSPAFYSELLRKILSEQGSFGSGVKKGGKTIVEFPSVNPNKPWHIGHLRNALLGDSVARLLEFSGENVERMDFINDLGLQVAQSFWGYRNMGVKPTGKFDQWVGGQYVEVSKRFESDEKIQSEVRALLKKMEAGSTKEARECRKMVEECIAAQYETAFRFGIFHDVLVTESEVMRAIFEEGMGLLMENKSVVLESEGKNKGCWVARLSGEFKGMENPDKVLIRSDGTATYTGKDAIFHLWKLGRLKSGFLFAKFLEQPNGKNCYISSSSGKAHKFGNASRTVNVIGMEQAYPQKVNKEVIRSLGYSKEADSIIHLSYEHVWLDDAKFSGRKGTWLGYTVDDLYSEAIKHAEGKIKPEVSGDQRGLIASSVASSAIRFSFLKATPEKKITFRWDDAFSLEGDSAPYVLYAHARAHKILEKAGEGKAAAKPGLGQAEKNLLNGLMLFDSIVERAAGQLRPHIIAEYCLEVATLYNRFYNSCPVLSCEKEEIRNNRLAINYSAKRVLKNALSLLGIEALERM